MDQLKLNVTQYCTKGSQYTKEESDNANQLVNEFMRRFPGAVDPANSYEFIRAARWFVVKGMRRALELQEMPKQTDPGDDLPVSV